jgi:hypothetical protein
MTPQLARAFGVALAHGTAADLAALLPAAASLASWLTYQGLAPLVYQRCQEAGGAAAAALAGQLQGAYYSTSLHNGFQRETLVRILSALQSAQIPTVLLKGAALAEAAYGSFNARPMSDIDFWLPDGVMTDVVAIMTGLGFRQLAEKEERPLALQRLARGEIQFSHPDWPKSLVELHWSGFPGWWLQRTAAVDDEAVWQRTVPLTLDGFAAAADGTGLVRRLAAEDMVIQLAVHQAINTSFGVRPLASLLDIALAANCWPVDWQLVTDRAHAWRVGTVVWLVFHLAQQLIGLPGAETAVAQLSPSPLRRAWLLRLVNPGSLVSTVDPRHGLRRYLLLLLLIDRPRDLLRLVYRAVWPEPEWLAARYGGAAGRGHHLWEFLRSGRF